MDGETYEAVKRCLRYTVHPSFPLPAFTIRASSRIFPHPHPHPQNPTRFPALARRSFQPTPGPSLERALELDEEEHMIIEPAHALQASVVYTACSTTARPL